MHLGVSFCYNNLIISTNNDTRRYLGIDKALLLEKIEIGSEPFL